jgi:hypothetical protein
MHKRMLLYAFILIGMTTRGSYAPYSTTFIGSAVYQPSGCKLNLPAYYKGSQVEIKDGSYALKEDCCSQEFFILFTLDPITAQLTESDECNTIGGLRLSSPRYKCYRISHNSQQSILSQKNLNWKITPVKLKKIGDGSLIPDNTLIILANPSYVEGLEQETWKTINSTYRLPKIIFRANIREKSMVDMMNEALVASLDMRAFHRKPATVQDFRYNKPSVASITTG